MKRKTKLPGLSDKVKILSISMDELVDAKVSFYPGLTIKLRLNENDHVESGENVHIEKMAPALIYRGTCKWLEDDRARQQPPRSAELLLTVFASTKHAEAMIGDLNERYPGWCKRFGVRQARGLYWVRASQSIGPLLLRWLGKVLKWAAVISTVKRALGW